MTITSEPTDWYRLSATATAERLEVDPLRGLPASDVAARLEQFGPNQLEEAPRRPAWKRFLDQFKDLIELFRELSSDPQYSHPNAQVEETREYDEYALPPPPLRQVIVNTHSSELVREVYRHAPGDLLMASRALIGRPAGSSTNVLRLHPMVETWRCSGQERGVTLPVVSYVGRAIRRRADASAAEGWTPHSAKATTVASTDAPKRQARDARRALFTFVCGSTDI
jgi:hypothetical protein